MTTAEMFQQLREQMYDKWLVTLEFRTPVHGGIPAFGSSEEDVEKGKNILRAWIKKNPPEGVTTEEQVEELVEKTAEEIHQDAEAQATTTFKVCSGAICLEGRQVSAMA